MSTQSSWRQRWPRLFLALRALKYLGRNEPIDPLTRSVLAVMAERLEVAAGPFRGLTYLPAASGSGLLPKLVGTYELEIQPIVSATLTRSYDTVVNIGCGEGYYAVGYARALPRCRVVAFDTDPLARQHTRRLAAANGITPRLRVEATCDPPTLGQVLSGRSLVVCDCEGCELGLLDPAQVPELADADLLVELHDFLVPGLSKVLLPRFADSHELTVIHQRPRSRADLPPTLSAALNETQCAHALDEGRPVAMQWAWLEARSGR